MTGNTSETKTCVPECPGHFKYIIYIDLTPSVLTGGVLEWRTDSNGKKH